MKKTESKSTPKSKVNKTAVAVGVAGMAAAAVGAYFLYGSKNAAKNRKVVSSWILKARAEVMEAVEKLENIDRDTYYNIVDRVMEKYSKLEKNNPNIPAIAKEIKSAWSYVRSTSKPVKKVAKKVVRKVSSVAKKVV